ncbi:MAG TPA: AAA family ATPase, partial [Acidimicrobiales bacterium]|nr:AAA family ATPase [Acidimicrobiales bacterium]
VGHGPHDRTSMLCIGHAAAVPAVYQLLGYPGTGKYTVAKAIVEHLQARGEPAALLDNHATASLIWSLVEPHRMFEPEVMARMNELRRIIVETARDFAGPNHSIVFTNFVPSQTPGSVLDPHRDLAVHLDRPLVAVVLRCDTEEVLRRVPNAERAARHKLVNADIARKVMGRGMSLPDWAELVDLDTTGLTAEETAARIVAMADARS